jgi:hypothetical protein
LVHAPRLTADDAINSKIRLSLIESNSYFESTIMRTYPDLEQHIRPVCCAKNKERTRRSLSNHAMRLMVAAAALSEASPNEADCAAQQD